MEVAVGSGYIGHLVWYTIHDALRVSRDELEAHFAAAGISPQFFPERIRAVDAFRRATKQAERANLPVPNQEGLRMNLLVREVSADNDQVVRHLVRELVNARQVRLSYETVGEWTFRRALASIRTYRLAADMGDQEVGRTLRRAEELFADFLVYYRGEHIRRVVQQMLENMAVTPVRPSGGVYFVPARHKDSLERIGALMGALDQEWFTMPVIDSENTRGMVLRKFSAEVAATINALAEALKEEGEVSQARAVSLLDTAKRLLGNVEEYEQALQSDLRDLKQRVEIMRLQMLSLVNRQVRMERLA